MACARGHALLLPRKVRHYSSRVLACEGSVIPAALPTAAYVHLPFCKRRCHYCDFPIVALGESSSNAGSTMESYVDLVCQEIAAERSPSRGALQTVFFGGGTPSLIPIPLLQRIIQALEAKHGFSRDAPMEISMEMDPGTFSRDYLAEAIQSCGINRVSLGVQAFDDDLLKLCGRSHCLDDVFQSIEWIKDSLQNWSLDLISSLPHHTLASWRKSLEQAIAASPAHVSIYDLQIEQGTKFGNLYKPGMDPLPSDDDSAEFFKLGSSMLREAGYDHYEISNYARKGFQCRHNLVYWKNQGYYAYGLGSTSFVDGKRVKRSKRMREYAKFVEALAAGSPVLPESLEGSRTEAVLPESVEDRILDTVMLALRLAEGIDLRRFEAEFGSELAGMLCDGLAEFVASGNVVFLDASRECTAERARAVYGRLTDPNGFLVSNEIISRLFCLVK
ncbi:uncharacterized protein LOC9641851 [Selaginella moellendorffii]|nr:uncharacterized protein LOC9641851 [Selaginella moellendorffii]|eukprot:XP_002971105.2 uncharacterized protein LOC9641851 [Selaginella moellendorffii]